MKLSALGRYEIRGEIGRGTMGVVYRGYDPVIDREIAVKTILLPDTVPEPQRKNYLARFFQEARIAGKLLHTNIVVTYDAATDDETETPFIAMELVEGESLATTVARRKRLPWNEAFDLAISMAGALDYAHQNGIIHRDIKPANVLVSKKGELKITDFGIAKMRASELTQDGVVLGTPYFMSPEQLQGEKLDGRSDLFALGTLLYNLIVGTPPFEAPDIKAVSELVLYKDPRPPSEVVEGIPHDVDGVLARAMTKARDDRYPSGRAFAEDMAAVREDRRPTRVTVPAEQTPAEGDATSISIPPSAVTAARVEKTTSPSETAVDPPAVLETLAKPPRSGRLSRWLVSILVFSGIVSYVVAVGPERVKEQIGPWWTRLSNSMGRQVESIQTAVEETRAEQKRVSAAQARAESLLQRGRAMEARGQWDRARQEYGIESRNFPRNQRRGRRSFRASCSRSFGIGGGQLVSRQGRLGFGRIGLPDLRPAGRPSASPGLSRQSRAGSREPRSCGCSLRSGFDFAEELPDRRPWLEARFNMALQDLLEERWAAARERLRLRCGAMPERPSIKTSPREPRCTSESIPTLMGISKWPRTWWEEARRTFQAGGEVSGLAEIELVEGRADLDRGDLGSSRKHINEAERAFRKAKHLPGLAAVLENRLELTLTEGDDEQQVILEELITVRDRLALPELDMPSRGGDDVPVGLDEDARFTRLASLLRALPRTALAEERLATFRAAGSETGKGS